MDFGLGDVVRAWHWMVLGAVLIGLEILLPGTLLMWFGIAAILTGGVLALTGVGFAWQLMVFGAIAVIVIFPVRRLARRFLPGDEDEAAALNRRGAEMVGRKVTITEDVVNGAGAARFGDTRWTVRSEASMRAGDTAVIVRVEGATLHVEPTP